jgi:hypothetical protein
LLQDESRFDEVVTYIDQGLPMVSISTGGTPEETRDWINQHGGIFYKGGNKEEAPQVTPSEASRLKTLYPDKIMIL